ncbi:hypothetical protein J7M02_02030 [Candidatus Aerophobetes bacterium]|nr:hypothetical protein [Candidatus Aerophobetes bacterium]
MQRNGSVNPANVLGYGKLRYLAGYTNDPFATKNWPLVMPEKNIILKSKSTLFHSSEKVGYTWKGLPPREEFNKIKAEMWNSGAISQLRKHGIILIYYIASTRIRGDERKRTEFYDFYDHRWEEYEDYFGPKPSVDPTEWARVTSTGEPAIYTTECTPREHGICINKPFVRNYVKGAIRIAVDLGAQGVFFDDSPIFCYCKYCDAKFREHLRRKFSLKNLKEIFGINDINEVVSSKFVRERLTKLENPLFVEWRRFRAINYVEYLAEMREYGQSLISNFVLTDNACLWEGEPYRQYDFAVGPIEEWIKVLDLMFIEAKQYGNPKGNKSFKETNSPVLKYCHGASRGKAVSYLTNMGTLEYPPAYTPLVKIGIAECHANKASFIYIPRWSGWKKEKVDKHNQYLMAGVEEYNEFLASHESLFVGAKLYANVALLCSLQQAYGKQMSYPMAISRMLTDEQIPHLMLVDGDLENGEKLQQFDALILPEVPMMSNQQIKTVEKFVEDGGGIIIFGPTAIMDEYGRLRSKELGFHRLLKNMEPWGHIDRRIDPVVGVNTTRKGYFGKGRVIYIPRDAYISFPPTGRDKVVLFKEMASITADKMTSINIVFTEIIGWVCHGRLSGYCSANSTVEYTLMDQPEKKRVIVHLVNYKVDRKGIIIPEKDIFLKIAMPNRLQMNENFSLSPEAQTPRPKSAQLLSPDFKERIRLNLKKTKENDWWYAEFVVPQLRIYDIVVIDYETLDKEED